MSGLCYSYKAPASSLAEVEKPVRQDAAPRLRAAGLLLGDGGCLGGLQVQRGAGFPCVGALGREDPGQALAALRQITYPL